jgi:hypothetical protein
MSDRRRRNDPALSKHCVQGGDRRRATRYETNGTPAVLGWYDGAEYRNSPAVLIDISLGGLSAWVEVLPPAGGTVWFQLGGEGSSPWVEAIVVEAIRIKVVRLFRSRTRFQVRLRFAESCPYNIFKAAIEGFTRDAEYRDPTFEGRNWR